MMITDPIEFEIEVACPVPKGFVLTADGKPAEIEWRCCLHMAEENDIVELPLSRGIFTGPFKGQCRYKIPFRADTPDYNGPDAETLASLPDSLVGTTLFTIEGYYKPGSNAQRFCHIGYDLRPLLSYTDFNLS